MAAGNSTPKSRYTASTAMRMDPPPRPSSIPELANRAFTNLWDPSKDFKHWLRVAERCRNTGKDYIMMGDLENAFVEYARAATLILDKMPTHSEYMTRLNHQQRESLTLHGQELLKNLGQLKPTLAQRFQAWQATQSTAAEQTDAAVPRQDRQAQDWKVWHPPEGPRTRPDQQDQDSMSKQKSLAELRARVEEKSRQEQLGIAQRQKQAEAEARAIRANASSSRPSSMAARPSDGYESNSDIEVPILPLESPTRYDGDSSTDAEGTADEDRMYRRLARMQLRDSHELSSSRPAFGIVSPPPVTTTSPAPPSFQSIHYPELMSQHQRTQGYTPSLQSMFQKAFNNTPPSSLLFEHGANSLYSNIMPTPSQPVEIPRSRIAYPEPTAREHTYTQSNFPQQPEPPTQNIPPRISSTPSRSDPVLKELKKVDVPRDVLPRFLAIAALNTARNRETCGLMLGRTKGQKFLVTTLLIPKQHSTSDTCMMDEEELVLEFTEQRSLITLGWIHTHPSQSCFMSSVDLHTHSGFQRMLPESFAIVCAPKSTPNFGIFRLTDPPGLQTILSCEAKEAFHPHPDLPIYTDADKGHVQMKDMSLEIVDLR